MPALCPVPPRCHIAAGARRRSRRRAATFPQNLELFKQPCSFRDVYRPFLPNKVIFLAAHITLIACHNNARQLPCAALAGPAGEARRRPTAPRLLGHSPTATSIPSWGRAAPAPCSSSTPRQGPMGCRGRKEGDGGEQMGSEDGDLVSGVPSPSAQRDFPVHLCFLISPSQPHKSAAPASRRWDGSSILASCCCPGTASLTLGCLSVLQLLARQTPSPEPPGRASSGAGFRAHPQHKTRGTGDTHCPIAPPCSPSSLLCISKTPGRVSVLQLPPCPHQHPLPRVPPPARRHFPAPSDIQQLFFPLRSAKQTNKQSRALATRGKLVAGESRL